MPDIRKFVVDQAVVAKTIYRGFPHETTSVGVVLERSVTNGLQRFLEMFLDTTGCPGDSFLRVDAFIQGNDLGIVEINSECQEGWGIGMNLQRAVGYAMTAEMTAHVPEEIIVYKDDYLPEFQMAQSEAGLLGRNISLVPARERPGVPARSAFDSKMYLARFSRAWNVPVGQRVFDIPAGVRVPVMYSVKDTPWESVPENVVFKQCVKYLPDGSTVRQSVVSRSEIGKGKFMRRCYDAGDAVAQDCMIPFALPDGSVTQIILMCKGARLVTGYLQVAPPGTFIINDRTSRKGPLVTE